MKREMAVAGAFYPNSPKEIETMLKHYNSIIDTHLKDKEILNIKPKAVVVPHAGYIYSAFTANIAYRILKNSSPKSIVVIGPSHRVYLDEASISLQDSYETPFGELKIDKELSETLQQRFGLSFIPKAHKEHSTEVQMPFIKYYFKDVKVIEIVYGKISPSNIQEIIEFLFDHNIHIVISTDLSHYYDLQKANAIDSICLEAVAKLDSELLHQGCEACGIIGLEAMINSAKRYKLKPIILDYRTSADASGDKSAVVGYMSAAFV